MKNLTNISEVLEDDGSASNQMVKCAKSDGSVSTF